LVHDLGNVADRGVCECWKIDSHGDMIFYHDIEIGIGIACGSAEDDMNIKYPAISEVKLRLHMTYYETRPK
jgi:hypothetical protein